MGKTWKRKALSVLMALCLVAVMMPLSAPEAEAAGPTPITNVALTLTTPKAGKAPEYRVTLPANAPYRIATPAEIEEDCYYSDYFENGVCWHILEVRTVNGKDVLDWYPMEKGKTFEVGKKYAVVVALAEKDGYTFTESTSATINGEDAEFDYSDDPSFSTQMVNAEWEVDSDSAEVRYMTHIQLNGWEKTWKKDGQMSGTSGESKRLEAIKIDLGDTNVAGSIEYRTHIQNLGWETTWKKDGQMSGTSGKAYRLEAIQIRLTGQMAEKYDVYYRVHAQNFGWMDWAKNGAYAGTAGYAYRLEGIEIKLVKKGGAAPGSTKTPYRYPMLSYTTHVQDYGWQANVLDGVTSGTVGKSKRLEAIKIQLKNQECAGNIEYRTHIQNIGWETSWKKNGAMSGTSGKAYRLEAIQIRLTDQMAAKYDIYYRVHAQNFGWMGWAKNGASAGTAGFAYRLEGIQIVIVPKGSPAPGSTANCFRQK